MDVKKLATEYHEKGFNCAQSVLCACGAYTGLDEKTALAVSGGFGGGLRCGEYLDVLIDGEWVPTRIEMRDGWFLV